MKRKPSQFKLSPAQRQVLKLLAEGYKLDWWYQRSYLTKPLRPSFSPPHRTLQVLVREGFLYTRRIQMFRGMIRYYLTVAGRKAAREAA